MTMNFTADVIERTLQQFYHDAQTQKQANEILIQAQVSMEAWNFAWLLLNPQKSQEVQFFGASTLQMKISKFWFEVSEDQYVVLRNKLLEAVVVYAGGPKIILTRLCVALSSFVIRTVPNHWSSAISDIISTLQPQNIPSVPGPQVLYVLLELLTVLPEEFQTMHLSTNQKEIVHEVLKASVPQILSLVQDVLLESGTANNDLCLMALKCYSSWSQLGPELLQNDALLHTILRCVHDEKLCHTALEALSNVAAHIDAHKYPNTVIKLIRPFLMLEDLLIKFIHDKDMDTCCGIYDLLINVGETHCRLLLDTCLNKPEHRENILRLISLILRCSGTPGQYPVDEVCSEHSFGFWYTLQDDIVASDPPRFEACIVLFHPVFHSLVDIYLTKVRYPSDKQYQQWHSDEKEAFRCYRQDVGDSMMYCYNILRDTMLANLMAHLTIATGLMQEDAQQWQYLEACLYAFQSVAESVDLEENIYLPQFFSSLPNIPLQHLRVISTAMDAIGAYAEWINLHLDVLVHLVPLLIMGLQNAEVAPSATMALKDITRDCQMSMMPFAERILSSSREALHGTVLKSRERLRLMTTIGQVLSIMPFEFIMPYITDLLTPHMQLLQVTVSGEPSLSAKSVIILHLNMLSVLFGTLDVRRRAVELNSAKDQSASLPEESQPSGTPQPVLVILQQVLPLLVTIGANWASDEQVTEALCECLKKAVCTLLCESQCLVDDILKLNLGLYQVYPHTSVLDVSKQIMVLFHQNENLKPKINSFFAAICSHTLNLCKKDLREHTSVLEYFFLMLSQLIKKAPEYLVGEEIDITSLFQCGIASLSLPEKLTVKAASGFIAEFVSRSREAPRMVDTVNHLGEMLVNQILRVIGGESPRTVVEHMPDILMALSKKYFDNLCRWLGSSVHTHGFPSLRVTAEQKEHFIRMVLKERTNKRKLKENVNEFSLLCRGLIGTAYGAQSLAVT